MSAALEYTASAPLTTGRASGECHMTLILRERPCRQMRRLEAATVGDVSGRIEHVAEMVNLMSLRDGPDEFAVGDSMYAIGAVAISDHAVAAWVRWSSPKQACSDALTPCEQALSDRASLTYEPAGARAIECASTIDLKRTGEEISAACPADARDGSLVGHQAHSWCQARAVSAAPGHFACLNYTAGPD